MKIAKYYLSKFDNWFSLNFWWIFTNGRKVNERRKVYEKPLSVDDKMVYDKAKPLLDSSEHLIS